MKISKKQKTYADSLREDENKWIDDKSSHWIDLDHDFEKIDEATELFEEEIKEDNLKTTEYAIFFHLLMEMYSIKRQIFAKIDSKGECNCDN